MKTLRLALVGCTLAIVVLAQHQPPSSGYATLVKDAKTRIKEIDIEQYKKLSSSGEKYLLVDVREDNEWADGHAASAVHMG